MNSASPSLETRSCLETGWNGSCSSLAACCTGPERPSWSQRSAASTVTRFFFFDTGPPFFAAGRAGRYASMHSQVSAFTAKTPCSLKGVAMGTSNVFGS